MTLLGLILLIVGASLIGFLIKSAPEAFISATYKPMLLWVVLVIVILIILAQVFGGTDILNYKIGK